MPYYFSYPCRILLLLFFLAGNISVSGNSSPIKDHPVDSLRALLLHENNDTTKLILRYRIAEAENQLRISCWDSLLKDMQYHHMFLYQCRIYEKIALLYSARGNTNQAIEISAKGLALAEKYHYTAETISLVKKLEHFYAMQYDRNKSLDYVYKGLKIAEEANDRRSVIDFNSLIALHYYTSGEHEKALQMHFQCLKDAREIGYDDGIVSALLDIGSDYSTSNQEEKSVPYYLESKKYLPAMGESVAASQVCLAVCAGYRMIKNYDSAHLYADKGYKIAVRLQNKKAIASALTAWGCLYYMTGDYPTGKKHLLKALSLTNEISLTAQLPAIYRALKEIYTREGNYKEALRIYILDQSLSDSLSGEKTRKDAMEKEFSYNLGKKENEYALLAREHEIKLLQLKQNRYLQFGTTGLLLVILVMVFLLRRQQQLKTEHNRLQLERKLLQAQMNPHFLFNSMNSIQQLVMDKENDRAEKYLSNFSGLIRDLLESSTKENITVKEELDMLRAYIEMEALRLGRNTFSYTITVDEKINKEHTHIPHLMIQPFVENAIWHGLLPKAGNRNLQISITSETEKTLRCTIDDNGIGREASAKKANSGKRSLALGFVQQRIHLIGKTLRISGSIDFLDKKDAEGNSLGTTAVITLPILNS